MAHEVLQLVTGEDRGKGDGHRPRLEHAEVEGYPVGRVGGAEAHKVAGLHPHPDETGGDAVSPLIELAVGDLSGLRAHSGPLGKIEA